MNKSLIFPDCFLRAPEYVNSCDLFFDELVGPPDHNYPSRESFDRMAALTAQENGPQLYEEDFDQLWNMIDAYKKTQDLGLIRAINAGESPNDPYFENRIARIQTLSRTDFTFRDIVWSAAQEAPVWTDDGLGTRGAEPGSENERHFGIMGYGLKAISRIEWARRNKWNIAAGSHNQYNALRAIQAATFNGAVGNFYPLVREFMEISVPHLVAKSYEDVLELKEKLREHLEPFKIEIRKLYFQVPQNIQLHDAVAQMHGIVQKDIVPKVYELEKFLASENKRLTKNLLIPKAGSFATTTATLIGCITASVSSEAFLQVAPKITGMVLPFTHLMGTLIKEEWDKVEVKIENPFTFAVLSKDKYAGQLE